MDNISELGPLPYLIPFKGWSTIILYLALGRGHLDPLAHPDNCPDVVLMLSLGPVWIYHIYLKFIAFKSISSVLDFEYSNSAGIISLWQFPQKGFFPCFN